MTSERTELLGRAKHRAGELAAHGDLRQAVAAMIVDLSRYRLFTDGPTLAFLELSGLHQIIRGRAAVQRWIDGFV